MSSWDNKEPLELPNWKDLKSSEVPDIELPVDLAKKVRNQYQARLYKLLQRSLYDSIT